MELICHSHMRYAVLMSISGACGARSDLVILWQENTSGDNVVDIMVVEGVEIHRWLYVSKLSFYISFKQQFLFESPPQLH